MAFSSERTSRSLNNGAVMETYSFDADGVTEGTIQTGLGTILHVSMNNAVTEGDGKAVPSSSNGSGSVALSGLTANDTGTVVVIGR